MNGGGTVVLKPTAKNRSYTSDNTANSGSTTGHSVFNVSNATDGNLSNVVGFRDLNNSGNFIQSKKNVFSFSSICLLNPQQVRV